MATEKKQDYLVTIYKQQKAGEEARSSRIAESMGVSAAAVTDMLKRLQAAGDVERTPDGGVILTHQGEAMALSTVRKHRIVERFLTDIIGLPWERAHAEAEALEHVLSSEVEAGLERLLDNPETCPHGHPIPEADGTLAETESIGLDLLPVGECGWVSSVTEESGEMLRYLASLGITPDTEICVKEEAPFRGPLLVSVRGAIYALGRDIAEKISVVPGGGRKPAGRKGKRPTGKFGSDARRGRPGR